MSQSCDQARKGTCQDGVSQGIQHRSLQVCIAAFLFNFRLQIDGPSVEPAIWLAVALRCGLLCTQAAAPKPIVRMLAEQEPACIISLYVWFWLQRYLDDPNMATPPPPTQFNCSNVERRNRKRGGKGGGVGDMIKDNHSLDSAYHNKKLVNILSQFGKGQKQNSNEDGGGECYSH